MDLVWTVLYALAFAVVVGAAVWRLRAHARRHGGAFAWTRAYRRSVVVDRPYEEAHRLCHEGLREVLRTITTQSRRRGRFRALASDRETGLERHRIDFSLEPLDPARTRIDLVSKGTPGPPGVPEALPTADQTRARLHQVDRLADWLAEHGRYDPR